MIDSALLLQIVNIFLLNAFSDFLEYTAGKIKITEEKTILLTLFKNKKLIKDEFKELVLSGIYNINKITVSEYGHLVVSLPLFIKISLVLTPFS